MSAPARLVRPAPALLSGNEEKKALRAQILRCREAPLARPPSDDFRVWLSRVRPIGEPTKGTGRRSPPSSGNAINYPRRGGNPNRPCRSRSIFQLPDVRRLFRLDDRQLPRAISFVTVSAATEGYPFGSLVNRCDCRCSAGSRYRRACLLNASTTALASREGAPLKWRGTSPRSDRGIARALSVTDSKRSDPSISNAFPTLLSS